MKKFFLFALVATMFAACVTSKTQDVAVELSSDTLTVSFEDSDSRIQLNEVGKTVWTKGDLASVFYRSNANQKWQYQGETGERTGNLKRVNAGNATETMSRVVVVYPYSDNYYINTDTYNVEASLPASQNYLKDSYGEGGNIMISQSEFNQFSLKSVCGWLKVQLTGNGEKVKSIKLKGNNGEQVAGLLYINSATAEATLAAEMGGADDNENSAGGNLVFDDTILTEVTLNCGEGVALSSEPTSFFIALPPQTFTKGLTIEITSAEGLAMIKSTENEVVIERNHILPMAELLYKGEDLQARREIRYTAIEEVYPSREFINGGYSFGANIVSSEWNSITGEGVITFDGEVTSIGRYAFWFEDGLTGITIPNSVTSIGDSAFYSCDNLTSITIPDSVTSIGSEAFCNCSSLTAFYGNFASTDNRCLIIDGILNSFAPAGLIQYSIPDSVTSIGSSVFEDCRSLTTVTIPDSVTSIGGGAFRECRSLTTVTIPDSVTSIGGGAFRECRSLTSITIPDSVQEMGDKVFYGCTSLISVIIGNGVTLIDYTAFVDCTSLKNITIGNSVTMIESEAFCNCTSLTNITIPDSVTSIGGWAFAGCTSLTNVYCKPTTPPIGDDLIFLFYSNGSWYPLTCNIYVPRESVEAYKSAQYWSEYADYIVGYDF